MKSKDHKVLSKYLIEKTEYSISYRCRYAFIYGTLEPDLNPFTYLRGSLNQQMLRGHNYDNVQNTIKKLINKLKNEKEWGVRKCFLLGKLIHYIADIFTYPHNRIFTGTLKEHCQYESEFHLYFNAMLERDVVMGIPDYDRGLFQQIEEYHQQYLKAQRDFSSDSIYIVAITSMVFSYFMEVYQY